MHGLSTYTCTLPVYPCWLASLLSRLDGIYTGWADHLLSSLPLHAGGIPVGYRYQAKSHSESTHEIPIEDFEYAEKDYRRILRELEVFVESSDEREIPPVFSKVFVIIIRSERKG